jgi:branched-chain amino acid aminotransferase
MDRRLIHLNGKLVAYEDARIHVQSCAVKYGTAVFEGLRAYWSDEAQELFVFRLREHAARLFTSLRLMRLAPDFTECEIGAWILETLRRNALREDVHVRVLAYLAGDVEMDATGPVGVSIDARPRRLATGAGLSACVSTWTRISDGCMPPRIKATGNYVNARLATLEARSNGYDIPLLLNQRGKLAEAPAACCFIVRDSVLTTPPITADILESITRATLLAIAPDAAGVRVVEREIDRTELYVADEVFVCGTAYEITPITTVDRLPVGTGEVGPVTAALQRAYLRLVRGEVAGRQAWLAPVLR